VTHCPHCHQRIVQKSGDGRLKIRTKIVAIDGKGIVTSCRRCGQDVALDADPGESLQKMLSAPEPRLVLRPRKSLDE
jgi:DNA-directed RNA polymerase subunit RPC12/RpoP